MTIGGGLSWVKWLKKGVDKIFVFHAIFLMAGREVAGTPNMVSTTRYSPDKNVYLPQLCPYQPKMFHPVINIVKGA